MHLGSCSNYWVRVKSLFLVESVLINHTVHTGSSELLQVNEICKQDSIIFIDKIRQRR